MSPDRFLTRIRDFKNRHDSLWKSYAVLTTTRMLIRLWYVFRKIKYPRLKRDCKVIVFSVRTIPGGNLTYFDSIFAHGFQKLGCEVKMLLCDGVLCSCDAETVHQDQRQTCFHCNFPRPLVKRATRLDYISFKQYVSPSDIEAIRELVEKLDLEECCNYEYLGVNVGKYARSSAIRFFLAGWLDSNNPQHVAIVRKKLVNAMIVTKVASGVYSEEKPDRILMLHGIYSTWGPFADFFINRGIDVIIYAQMVSLYGSFFFARNRREDELIAEKTWSEFKQIPLSSDEETQIDAYLSARFKGVIGELLIFEERIGSASDKQSLLASLSGDQYSRRYVMYPNVAWDACVEARGSDVFNDLFAWLDATIDFFKEHPDYQLIIKLHPAEVAFEHDSKSLGEYIFQKHPGLPANISVLKPDTPIRAYELVTPGTICLTFGGTIGLELATQGVPALAAGNSHYIDSGVVRKITSLEEYLSLLENPEEIVKLAQDNVSLAKKYAYFFFLRLRIKMPFYRGDTMTALDWSAMRDINKLLDYNQTVMHICERIVGKDDILLPFE